MTIEVGCPDSPWAADFDFIVYWGNVLTIVGNSAKIALQAPFFAPLPIIYVENCQVFSGAEISSLVGSVIETAFRDFIVSEDNQKKFAMDEVKIKIKKKTFIEAAKEIRPYVMSNQLNDDKKDSAIVRISKLKKDFNLKSASKQQ